MNVLGLHFGHDASACLVMNGCIVADVAEERFSRIKHDGSIPAKSAQFCLSYLNGQELDMVAIAGVDDALQSASLIEALKYEDHFTWTPPPYFTRVSLSHSTEVIHVDHHLAHAASAYYTNSFRGKQLIITIDGMGDGVSVAVWRGDNNVITQLAQFGPEGSIGWFYSIVTEALGWAHNDGEGKTMGLSAYGDAQVCLDELRCFCPIYQDGNLVTPTNISRSACWNLNGSLHYHLEDREKIAPLVNAFGRENVAAAGQFILEEQVVHNIIVPWLEKESVDVVSCSGGVFLNVKVNQRIWELGKVNQWIFPNAGDAGLACGAALWAFYKSNPSHQPTGIDNVYWGPQYSDSDIQRLLDVRKIKYSVLEDVGSVATALAEGAIVGWFNGRMESGPRALGNRSILMSPKRSDNKDALNNAVKFREPFRPFCPSILESRAGDYLHSHRLERYMTTSFNVNNNMRTRIPAVVHVDGTVRPQTVTFDTNAKLAELLTSMERMGHDPVLLNTSFNLSGEPIVCSPRDAIRSFYDSGMDVLVLGNFLIRK